MTNYKHISHIATCVAATAIALAVVAVSQTYALELAQDNASPPAPRRTNRAPAPPPHAAQAQSPAAAQSQSPPQNPAPQQPAPAAPVPQRTEILRFDNWIVTCNEFTEPAPHRECAANMQVVAQGSNQVVLQWTLGFDNNHQPAVILQTPTGVAIAPGVELRFGTESDIKAGKAAVRHATYTVCEANRCLATLPVDATLLKDMAAAQAAEVGVHSSQGTMVQFNIPMKGFDKAYPAAAR
jgi:invasion protein IalB